MQRYKDLSIFTPKELRRLRMNLNNRLSAFKQSAKPKELQKSHMLSGLGEEECVLLRERVLKEQRARGEG